MSFSNIFCYMCTILGENIMPLRKKSNAIVKLLFMGSFFCSVTGVGDIHYM